MNIYKFLNLFANICIFLCFVQLLGMLSIMLDMGVSGEVFVNLLFINVSFTKTSPNYTYFWSNIIFLCIFFLVKIQLSKFKA